MSFIDRTFIFLMTVFVGLFLTVSYFIGTTHESQGFLLSAVLVVPVLLSIKWVFTGRIGNKHVR